MSAGHWAGIAVATLVLAGPLFFYAQTAEEDANHWWWADDDGPGTFVIVVHGLGSLLGAGLVSLGTVAFLTWQDGKWAFGIGVGVVVGLSLFVWPGERYHRRRADRRSRSDEL